ncbi:MAG: S8 family serine peptidase, partial [Planctomycetota bacterium]
MHHRAIAIAVLAGLAGSAAAQFDQKATSGTTGGIATAYDVMSTESFDLTTPVVSSGLPSDPIFPFGGTFINEFVGATRFYAEGYAGTGSNLAVVEGGVASSTHITTSGVSERIGLAETGGGPVGLFETQHPTQTAFVAGGRETPGPSNIVTAGIAFDSDLWVAGLATVAPNSVSGSFSTNNLTKFRTFTALGVTGSATGGETADVITMSYGIPTNSGSAFFGDVIVDAVAEASGLVAVAAAGNDALNFGPGVFGSPAIGFNSISVGATETGIQDPFYDQRAPFSSFGATAFFDRSTGTVIPGAYAAVDIVAPGTDITAPFVNATSSPDSFTITAGTSFAAPTVAGGAALVVEAGRDLYGGNDRAIDGRVVKAVLMNSADKLAGWDNGQMLDNGVITTFQSLDLAIGAGQMNLDQAFDQYTAGTTDVAGDGGGTVETIGWDYGQVTNGERVFYDVNTALAGGTDLTVTLTWFAEFELDVTPGQEFLADDRYADLDLEVYAVDDLGQRTLLAQSTSAFNETEHLSFTLQEDTLISIAVFGFGEIWDFGADGTVTDFGLAWAGTAVPGVPTLAGLL